MSDVTRNQVAEDCTNNDCNVYTSAVDRDTGVPIHCHPLRAHPVHIHPHINTDRHVYRYSVSEQHEVNGCLDEHLTNPTFAISVTDTFTTTTTVYNVNTITTPTTTTTTTTLTSTTSSTSTTEMATTAGWQPIADTLNSYNFPNKRALEHPHAVVARALTSGKVGLQAALATSTYPAGVTCKLIILREYGRPCPLIILLQALRSSRTRTSKLCILRCTHRRVPSTMLTGRLTLLLRFNR